MARKKLYVKLDGPIKEMPDQELRGRLDRLDKSQLMRTIILNELEFNTNLEVRTLRGFWYSTVKPVLSRLGKLQTLTDETITAWDQKLSKYMAEAVRDGLCTYQDLMIVDRSRPRESGAPLYTTPSMAFQYEVSAGLYPNIVLCTEKDTVVPILQQVASITGCSWLSGKGQNSYAAMEDLLRQIEYALSNRDHSILFLSVTDYDYSGYSIADTFQTQAESLKHEFRIRDIYADRLGISPDQITDTELAENAYYVKNADKWMDLTGGIAGEPLGLELDAYTPSRLRQVLVDGLRGYLNSEKIIPDERVQTSYAKMIALEAMAPHIEKIIEHVTDQYAGSVEVLPFDVFDYALQGNHSLPIGDICDKSQDQAIREYVDSCFVLT